MSEERKKILSMLAEGKITAEEAEELLNALYNEKDRTSPSKREARYLQIKVWEDSREKVNVNLPISLAKIALKFIPTEAKQTMEQQNIDIDAIIQEIMNGAPAGKIVEVNDDGNRVEIVIV